jgi:hypothetical protein
MSSHSARRAFQTFHVVLVLGMLTSGGFGLAHAFHDLSEHGHYALVAAVQVLGAVLLLIPRTVLWGGAMLLLVLLPTAIHQLIQWDQDPSRLVYAAGVWMIMRNAGGRDEETQGTSGTA